MPRLVWNALALFLTGLGLAVCIEGVRLAQVGVSAEAVLIVGTWLASTAAVQVCRERRFAGCYLVAIVCAESMLWFRFHTGWLQAEGLAFVLAFFLATLLRFVSLILLAQPRCKAWLKRSETPPKAIQRKSLRKLQLTCGLLLGLALTSFTPQSPWGGSFRLGTVSAIAGLILLVVVVIRSRVKADH